MHIDAMGSIELWQPINTVPTGMLERSDSLDGHSSDGFGFNSRDGNELYDSMSPVSLYGSSSPTEHGSMEALSIPPLALTRSASQPNPPADSYLCSPFKTGAASTSAPLSERKPQMPPRAPGSGAWSETLSGMDWREKHNEFVGGTQREAAPMWLSCNDSASSISIYGGVSMRLSYGSFGEGDVPDDDVQYNRHTSQPPLCPTSGRRALLLAYFSPKSHLQDNPAAAVSHYQPQHESEHNRRPIHAARPPAAAAAVAASSASQFPNEQVGIG